MNILPPHPEIVEYLRNHRLSKKFDKQIKFLEGNLSHPSLNVEVLEPKNLKIYSFRLDKKYRAIFIFVRRDLIEIIDVNNHYQ